VRKSRQSQEGAGDAHAESATGALRLFDRPQEEQGPGIIATLAKPKTAQRTYTGANRLGEHASGCQNDR
jgi:hypothetical protein